jgi:glycosyltransferase involved in cell wall biosynthesis
MLKVSVIMITYGHENYIKEAIEGVLMQKCNFQVELIIANDCSPDRTDSIIREMIDKCSNSTCIKYTMHKENLGMHRNFLWAVEQSKGKYIAMCEGDDYWIDDKKLEKQVNFLENNLDYAFCFHNSFCFDQNSKSNTMQFPGVKENSDFTIDDFLIKNIVPTASVIFVKDFLLPLPNWHKNILYGDYAMYLLTLFRSKKRAFYMSEVMSVYRLHNNGVFTSLTKSKSGRINISKNFLNLYKYFYYNVFDDNYKKRVRDIISYHQISIIILLVRNYMFLKSIRFIFDFLAFNPLYLINKFFYILKKRVNIKLI